MNRHFHLKLICSYETEKNDIKDLAIQVLHDNEWEELDLSIRSPGFLLYINALFSCQHLYMRANSAECNLILESSTGEILVNAGEFWNLKDITVSFNAKIKSGTATEENINYISERMTHCPVSTNLPDNLKMDISVKFT
ncbi:MAG: hypothetical protein HOM14_00535 [Gammaproteobacteria bacterium]|jgi:hypothetical protein|nr:hypothetical protein [Gammaproteobacteria bacterium]MBT3722022.1 hypothetical protein [Gammaproteobacteria bacterium]MBT4075895.1 hypothetical protein [Gammaproteobacteria bacterium]MBT4194983.1 hypothetical protein [Gammaproteobacteria bacterium]MBT4449475.1 hypothetical protein [Gammaproteobacteria bacterium]